MFKLIVVGCAGAGKTCAIRKLVYNAFTAEYRATIGVDFAVKMLKIPSQDVNPDSKASGDVITKLQLWDIAGQERFSSLTRAYYREALGALVVGDMESETFEDDIRTWKSDINAKVFFPDTKTPIPCVLMCNKIDKPKAKEQYDSQRLKDFAAEQGFIDHFPTSALTGENLDAAVKALCIEIIKKSKHISAKPTDGLVLPQELETIDTKKNGKCC